MTTEAKSLSTLAGIRLGKLLRPDSEYQRLFEKRKARLSSIEVSSEHLTEWLAKALELTEQSNLVAAELLSTMGFMESHFPSTVGEKLELVSQLLQQADADEKIELSEEVLAGVKDKERKANEFLVWLLSDKPQKEGVGDDSTVGDVLRERYNNESEFDLQLIGQLVSMRQRMLESFQLQLDTLIPMYALLKIFRGMLYVGILSVEGGRLDRKNTVDQLVDLGKELGGDVADTLVPGLGRVGLIISIAKLIFAWLELDASPELLRNADFVEHYFETYTRLLTEWNVAARALDDSTLSSARMILGEANA